jgi:hypothetical protein
MKSFFIPLIASYFGLRLFDAAVWTKADYNCTRFPLGTKLVDDDEKKQGSGE